MFGPGSAGVMTPRSVLALQLAAGNRAVTGALGSGWARPRAVQRDPSTEDGEGVPAAKAPTNAELIADAEKTHDIPTIKKITNFAAASEPQRIQFIGDLMNQTWVGPLDERALEQIWDSFGPRRRAAYRRRARRPLEEQHRPGRVAARHPRHQAGARRSPTRRQGARQGLHEEEPGLRERGVPAARHRAGRRAEEPDRRARGRPRAAGRAGRHAGGEGAAGSAGQAPRGQHRLGQGNGGELEHRHDRLQVRTGRETTPGRGARRPAAPGPPSREVLGGDEGPVGRRDRGARRHHRAQPDGLRGRRLGRRERHRARDADTGAGEGHRSQGADDAPRQHQPHDTEDRQR